MTTLNMRGQGALEYLLLLVAALFIVAIVFVFVNQSVGTATGAGNEQNSTFFCTTMDLNTADCACYNKNAKEFFINGPSVTTGDGSNYCCNQSNYLKTRWGNCPST